VSLPSEFSEGNRSSSSAKKFRIGGSSGWRAAAGHGYGIGSVMGFHFRGARLPVDLPGSPTLSPSHGDCTKGPLSAAAVFVHLERGQVGRGIKDDRT
jgi:hypothetical protein